MTIRILFSLIIILGSLCAEASVIDTSAGKLGELLEKETIDNNLIVRGELDARDFEVLRSLPESVVSIDLSKTSVKSFSSEKSLIAGFSTFDENIIPPYAFFHSRTSEIILPESITAIADGAFAHSLVKSVSIPRNVSHIGDYAFFGASRLSEITFPEALTSLGKGCFEDCAAFSSVNLKGTGIRSIPERCFARCPALTAVALPSGVVEIDDEAFLASSLKAFDSSSVVSFGNFVFADNGNLKSVSLNPEARFGMGLLMNCLSLETINGVPADIPDLFAPNCPGISISEIIGNAMSIGKFAFANNHATTLILSPDLVELDEGAIGLISGIKEIKALGMRADVPLTHPDAFLGVDTAEITLFVDSGYEEAWENHPVWKNFHIFPYSDGISAPEADDNSISISFVDNAITAQAPERIINISLFSINGTPLLSLTPDDCVMSIPTDGLSVSGEIIVIFVQTPSSSRSAKIIL